MEHENTPVCVYFLNHKINTWGPTRVNQIRRKLAVQGIPSVVRLNHDNRR